MQLKGSYISSTLSQTVQFHQPHLAKEIGLNPTSTGMKVSRFERQWSNWPATKGADSPHEMPMNKTVFLPEAACHREMEGKGVGEWEGKGRGMGIERGRGGGGGEGESDGEGKGEGEGRGRWGEETRGRGRGEMKGGEGREGKKENQTR